MGTGVFVVGSNRYSEELYREERLGEPLSDSTAMGKGAEALTSNAKRSTTLQLAAIAKHAAGQL